MTPVERWLLALVIGLLVGLWHAAARPARSRLMPDAGADRRPCRRVIRRCRHHHPERRILRDRRLP